MSSNPCANCGGLIPLDASYCISCGSLGRTTHFVVATYRQRALARLLDTIPILAVYSLVAALVGTFFLLVSLFLPGLKALALNLLPPGCTDPDALNEEYGCFSIIVYPILVVVCIIMFIIVIVLLILIVGIVIAIAALLSLLFFSAVVLALKGVWLRLFPFHQGTTFGKRRLGMRVIKKSGELAGGGTDVCARSRHSVEPANLGHSTDRSALAFAEFLYLGWLCHWTAASYLLAAGLYMASVAR